MIEMKVELEVYEAGGRGTRRKPIEIQSDLTGEVTFRQFQQFIKSTLILLADQVLREEQARGFTKNPTTFVDGKKNKPIQNVNPFGKIEFVDPSGFENKEIIMATFKGLVDRSPIDTGEYIGSHVVILNDTLVAQNYTDLVDWINKDPVIKAGDLLTFVNTAPYARKLERQGVTRGGSKSPRLVASSDQRKKRQGAKVLAPNGAYYLTYRSVARKYKRVKEVKFGFIPGSAFSNFPGIDFKSVDRRFRSAANLRGKKEQKAKLGRAYLYPSITIRF